MVGFCHYGTFAFVTTWTTLRASLSGTFLQTLPDLVTPLKGHSLFPRSCPATRSAPSERFGYWLDCGSNLAPKHGRKHETHPPRVKKKKEKKFCSAWSLNLDITRLNGGGGVGGRGGGGSVGGGGRQPGVWGGGGGRAGAKKAAREKRCYVRR